MPKVTVTQLLNRLYADTDRALEVVSKEAGVTCRAGCMHCCTLLAIVTVADGIYLADELMERPDWKEWLPKLAEASKGYLYKGVNKSNWFSKKVPCVFLKDNLCSVYSKRPAACRFHVVISPPENCAPDAKDPRTAMLDLVQLESQTSWTVSLQVAPIPLAAPIPLMTLFCMSIVAREKYKDRFDDVIKAAEGLPTPEAWIRTYGEELVASGEEMRKELGL